MAEHAHQDVIFELRTNPDLRGIFDKVNEGKKLDFDAWMRSGACGPERHACIQAAANHCAVNMMLLGKDLSELMECVSTTGTDETLHLAACDAGGDTRCSIVDGHGNAESAKWCEVQPKGPGCLQDSRKIAVILPPWMVLQQISRHRRTACMRARVMLMVRASFTRLPCTWTRGDTLALGPANRRVQAQTSQEELCNRSPLRRNEAWPLVKVALNEDDPQFSSFDECIAHMRPPATWADEHMVATASLVFECNFVLVGRRTSYMPKRGPLKQSVIDACACIMGRITVVRV